MKLALHPQIAVLLLMLGALFSNKTSAVAVPAGVRTVGTLMAFDEGRADSRACRISVLCALNGT